MLSDIELLEIELRTIWAVDAGGRLIARERQVGVPCAVIATARSGWRIAYSAAVPEQVARELGAVVSAGPHASDPAVPPAYIARCRALLAASLGDIELASGPSYRLPVDVSFPSAATVWRSDGPHASAITDMRPGDSGWTEDEWRALARGDLGPWAMAVEDGRVVSICHCSRLTAEAAEAGTWTDPSYRGRGYAAATTAAWAALMAASGRHLFYSTSVDNTSSQRVAGRLALPLIGWTWQLSRKGA
ncbi:MAG TPA: GNAT family N-acetyltransferase [Candidatus Tectomicrobia bacterium]|nr:GNAT family N-acetyltransferase [Candidatus Tectomicrobia bacterium]